MIAMFEKLRKFGLGSHDFETLVWNLSILLRVLTLNIDSRYKKRIPLVYYFFMMMAMCSYIYTFQVSAYWSIFFREGEEPLKRIIAFSQSITSVVGVCKFMHMYFKKNEVQELIDAFLLCHSKVPPQSRMSRNINITLRVVKKRALVFWVTVMVNLALYLVIRPLVITDRQSMKDYQQLWGLVPTAESPNYEITIGLLWLLTPVVVFGPIHVTIMLIVIVGYSEAQMIALTEELLNLWEDAQLDYSSETQHPTKSAAIDQFVKQRLENIMRSHALNKQLFRFVERVFKNGIAAQCVLLSISLVADLLSGLENTYSQIPFTVMLVGVDCFTGQNLMDASIAFEAAVYRCKWEKFGAANMKSVLMMLRNAQRNMRLSAGGVAYLDYAFFMYIIKSIYQVYAALGSKS